MMKTQSLVIIACVSLFATAHSVCPGQHVSVPAAQLASGSDSIRSAAFFEMVSAASQGSSPRPGYAGPRIDLLVARAKQQDALATALISLLERENAYLATSPKLDEDYGDGYYGYVVMAVVKLNDKRAVRALVGSINNGDAVTSAVARFGEAAVPELINALGTARADKRADAAYTLGKIIAKRVELNISDKSTAAIKTALLGAMTDQKNIDLRVNAVKALMPLKGDDIAAAMRVASTSDTGRLRLRPGKPETYPVRDASKAWLTKHSY